MHAKLHDAVITFEFLRNFVAITDTDSRLLFELGLPSLPLHYSVALLSVETAFRSADTFI